MIRINERLSIPMQELRFTASRSSGPGGQNVNKVNSRVTLHFDVGESPSIEPSDRRRILQALATRINRDGVLKLHTGIHRSQAANREALIRRFAELLELALRRRRVRRPTRPGARAKARRLTQKKQRGQLKKTRGPAGREDG